MPFNPVVASDSEIAECHAVSSTAFTSDFPTRPFPAVDVFAKQLRAPSPAGPRRFWVARSAGRIVGTAIVVYPEQENLRLAITTVRVLPAARRQGVGTALLDATFAAARDEGRDIIAGQGLKVGGDGEKWATGLGFTLVQEFVGQTLVVTEEVAGLWEVEAPRGFRAVRWIGSAPESLVDTYARARTAIADAPVADSCLEFPNWTPERVRAYETDFRASGSELRTVVAVHEASGRAAGLTELEIRLSRPTIGYQQDTAVLGEFRGSGLGRFLKAEMMRWLAQDRPELGQVVTNTASDNVHMIRVNHQLGYVTDYAVTDAEADIDLLSGR